MPIFVLAARLCPKGMEATMYATIMSVLNLSGLIGGQLGAGITGVFVSVSVSVSVSVGLSACHSVLACLLVLAIMHVTPWARHRHIVRR